MRKTLCAFIPAAFAACGLFAGAKLAENSSAKMEIVLPDSPTAVEQTAAKELKEHLDAASGADFKIVSHSAHGKSSPAIFVGDSPTSRAILGCADFSKLGYDSIKIKTSPTGDVALCGHPKRGSLYAAYTLLEDFVGVRWWSKSERFVPDKPTIELPDIDISYTPPLMLREALYKIAFDGVFASKMKQNGSTLTKMNFDRPVIPPEYGGCDTLVLFKGRGSSFHAHYEIIPPGKYFAAHPEWFSLIGGKRTHYHAQLCLTNEEMAAEYIKNVKKLLRENPRATSIQVSQNDWFGACQCPKCAAIDEENESHAGTNIYFANKVGEAIEKEFPHVFIDTFAYQYTRKAPKKITPRKNVLVRLCTIECSFVKPLEYAKEARNAPFVRDIKEWGKITNNLFIWDYVTCFRSYMMPHPNMRVFAPNIRFFVDNGAAGIFEQGDAFCTAGDFVLLRNWVVSHLMWNPNLDEKKLFAEFLNGYYGGEVGAIFAEYLDVLHDRAEASGMFIGCFTEGMRWLDAATYNKAADLIEKANAAAERLERQDPKKYAGLAKKVERESLSFRHMTAQYYNKLKYWAQKDGAKINLPPDQLKLARYLVGAWKRFDVGTWREFTTPEEFAEYQQALLEEASMQKIFDPIKYSPKRDFEQFAFTCVDFERIYKKGAFSANVEKDAGASAGYAAVLAPWYSLRAQLDFSELKTDKNGDAKFALCVRARADAKDAANKNAPAFSVRVMTSDWKEKARATVKLSDIAGGYADIKLCDVAANKDVGSLFIYMHRSKDAGEARIYIDRIYGTQE